MDCKASFDEPMLAERSRAEQLTARIERLPMTRWHTKIRIVMGTATFFDAFNALSVASALPVLAVLWRLDPRQIGTLIASGYVGQLIGAILFGWWAERVGRLPAALWSVAVFSVMSVACAFSWSFQAFLIFRLVQGIGLGGEVPVAATYINEISKASTRGRFFILYESLFLFGILVSSIVGSWIVPNFGWQYMFALGALPGLIALYLRRDAPESPRWLVGKGHLDEAERVISRLEAVALSEGQTLPPLLCKSLPVTIDERADARELFSGQYRKRTVVLWILWFCAFLISYATTTWFPTVIRSVFHMPLRSSLMFGVGLNAATLVISVISAYFIDIVGRRWWFTLSFLLCGLAMLAILFLGTWNQALLVVIGMVGIGAISTCGGMLYLYSPEIYPTRLRSRGVAIASCWGRIASIVGPYLVGFTLADYGIKGVCAAFAVLAFVGGFVSYTSVVETRRLALEEISQ